MNRISAFAFVFLFGGISARAGEPTADEILKLQDKAHANFKDFTVDATMTIREPGQKTGRQFSFTTISRFDEKRLVRFTAPGDIKGMGMLTESRDVMYAFLPGFQRVRRLGTHVKNQGFMGSDATFEDMAEGQFTGTWKPTLAGSEGDNWILDLALVSGHESEFAKKKIWVDKKMHQITKMEDYDAKGTKVRTQTRGGYVKDTEDNGGHYAPGVFLIVDHRRNDHSTELVFSNPKANTNVPEDTFSQRSLLRGQ